ncbi:hypothetical protein EDB86DRAFT_1866302 [Lactarius hatsudake]|nr:hypothetical protein EDB86DRAFT_1866302 [Lactarius hatsudake]
MSSPLRVCASLSLVQVTLSLATIWHALAAFHLHLQIPLTLTYLRPRVLSLVVIPLGSIPLGSLLTRLGFPSQAMNL